MRIRKDKTLYFKGSEEPKQQIPAVIEESKVREIVESILAEQPKPVESKVPDVHVHVPDRPKKWLMKVKRSYNGEIETISAEALD